MKLATDTKVIIAGVVVLGVVAILLKKQIQTWIANDKFNPASANNFVYDNVVNNTGAAITGDKNFDLGVWIWEKTHPGQVAAENQAIGTGSTGAW